MISFNAKKIKKELKRTAKSALSLLIAVVMVLSTFLALDLHFDILSLFASAAESQTKYSDINEYQLAEFSRIQNEIFTYRYNGEDYYLNQTNSTDYTASNTLAGYFNSGNLIVNEGNDYFNWVDTDAGVNNGTISRWGGNSTSGTSLSTRVVSGYTEYVASRSKSVGGTSYYVYDVRSAADFYAAMYQSQYRAYGSGGNAYDYMLINITNDIDMNGANYSFAPFNASTTSAFHLYIEGNGHTIYNMRIQGYGTTYGAGLFSLTPQYFACKNLGFQSSMILNTSTAKSNQSGVGLLAAHTNRKFYIENVHSNGAYMQTLSDDTAGMGGLIGRTNNENDSGDRFIRNCSTSNMIMFGGMHLGGLTSFASAYITYQGSYSANNNNNLRKLKQSYNIEFPSDPFSYAMNALNSRTTSHYPLMIFECSSTDSTLFSLGADSGSFISCGCNLRVKNCYSNNTIYAKNNTGGFIGRCADINMRGEPSVSMKDDNSNVTVSSHFQNCYSSGIVEGTVAMGGFVGLLNGRRAAEGENTEVAIESGKGAATYGSTVFTNCFSTAMVGMDYAGKYCGGFAGLDDNVPSPSNTINVDGTECKGRGTWYVNCYAAGEVGNILTVTDADAAAAYETEFFGSSIGAENDRSIHKDGTTIYDYYPTGGFIGGINFDRYRYHVRGQGVSGTIKAWFGNFYNCYYDMQTTAMREMAVGMAECNTNSTNEPGITPGAMKNNRPFSVAGVRGVYTAKSDTKKLITISGNYVTADGSEEISKADYDANPAAYAEKELMTMIGLTDMTDMDANGTSSTNWTYAQQYYPQISSMMVADLTKSSIKNVTADDINNTTSGKNAESSAFFIPDSGTSPYGATTSINTATASSYTKPVLSLASVQQIPVGDVYEVNDEKTGNHYTKQDYKPQVQTDFANLTAAAQMSEVVKAYRYSQAATATVFLDHWDLTMNTKTGDADKQDSDHVPSLDRNAMTRSGTMQINGKDVTLWSIKYTHLSADKYSFKVNAGDSMAFSYGKHGFAKSDDACELEVPVPNSDATIYFAFNGLNTDYYALYADVTTPEGTTTRQTWHSPPAEYQEDATPYILAGGFEGNGATNAATGVTLPNWKETDMDGANAGTARLRYDASISDDNNRIYKLAVNCPAGDYEFKVTHSTWADDSQWGADGVPAGGNMSLKLTDSALVTFLFNENTKKVTMEFDNANKAVAYNCGEHFVKREGAGVEGYSVLAHSEQIGVNTHWYVNSPEGLEAAARAGLMDPNAEETEYTYHFTLSGDMWSKNYAYKIIKDGVDEGPNQCFFLDSAPTSNAPSTLDLTIHYYPNNLGNARFSVTCDDSEIAELIHIDNNVAHYDSYGLTGVTELFGDSWLTSSDYLMGVDENDEGVFVYSFDEINFRYLGYQDGKLPAGSYSFKVVAGNTWESGLDYGDAKGGNYTFNLVQPADKVTVKFDPSSEADCKISVEVSPDTALDTKNYVITASAAFASVLGVEEWKKNYEDAQPAFMLFNNGTQRFEKWVYGVTPNDNVTLDEWGDEGYPIWCYGFKVIPVGNDDNKPNLLIELTKMRSSYDMYIGYDEQEDNVYIYAFENTGTPHVLNGQVNTQEADGYAVYKRSTGELISSSESQNYLSTRSLKPAFYTVLGEESLTEYNWSGNYLPSARRGLLVPANDGTNRLHLSEPYRVKNIKSQTEFGTSFSFKVSAGGTWDLSYPAIGNTIVTVAYPDNARSTASWAKNECDIDIYFDPDTHEVVDVTAYNGANAMSYIFELNEDELQWYVASTNKLFDQNMFSDQENVTVYDTVRDITSSFYFTYGSGSEQRGLMVESDAVRNTTDGFYNTDNFDLEYVMKEHYLKGESEVERYDMINGTFHADVIDLKNKTLTHEIASQLSGNEKDDYNGFVLSNNDKLTKFYVDQFAPGKKWLKINTVGYGYSNEYKNWQQQFLTYNNYIDDKEKFDRYEKLFLQLCSSFPYQGGKVNEFTLYAYLNERKNDPSDEVYASMVEALGYDILYWKNDLETRAANHEDVEPSSVFDSNTQFIVGSRDIRLIPSSYLEAGVDANVNVVQKAGDEANATNSVRLNYNTTGYASDDYEFRASVLDNWSMVFPTNGDPSSESAQQIDELSFGYYNYAMTSAYLSTDKVGLGISNNYNDQFMAHFVGDSRRDDDDPTKRNSTAEGDARVTSENKHRYFSMSSAYNHTDDLTYRYNYDDRASYDEDDYTKRTYVNLNAGYFDNMSIVGSTYDRNQTDEKEDAQTLVKIFKVNTDSNGNYIMNADGSFQTTPVYFSNKTNATTAYATNYKKWSGLTNFTAADTGYYEVQFNWVLSDGRYMQDTKYVDIKLVEPGITKTVNTEYETAGDNMLTYTIKYTNFNTELLVDFAILDILPFDGDVRYNPASGKINSTNLADRDGDLKFKLKAVTVQQSSKSDVREVYFTNSEQVRNWLEKTTTDESGGTVITTNEEAAKNLSLDESGFIEDSGGVSWTPLGHADSSLQKYSPGRYTTIKSGGTETELNHEATAVCLSGMQLATGQEITVEFTFAFEGEITDYYSNDAFYFIRATEATNTEDAGMSRPVGTAIVSRNLTGFAWLDNDGDGIIDSTEPKLQNMEVQLYRQISVTNPDTGVTTSSYVDTGSTAKTDTNGFYHFDNIESGYYEVRFVNPTTGEMYVVGSESKQVDFSDLRGTTKLREVNERRNETNVTEKGYTTRNLAVATQTNPEEQIEAQKTYMYSISGIYMPSNSLVYSNNNNHTMTNATDENYLYTRLFQNAGFGSIYDIDYKYSVNIDKTNDDEEKLEGVKFLFEYLNPNDGLWYPVKYKTVAEGTALETKVMDTTFTTPGTLGNYTGESWGEAVVERFEAETVPENSRTVYVVDKTGSDFLNMHYWGNTVNTSWPGTELRRVVTNSSGGNVYVAYVPEGTNGIIFNNKVGESGWQTSNIEGDNLKTTDTVYTINSDKSVTPTSEFNFREVYFVNTQGWDNVYAYGWGSSYGIGNRPGYPMRQLTDTLWSTLIPTDMTGLIFTNNAGSQTVNIEDSTLTNGTVFTPSDEKDGEHYKVDTDIVAKGNKRVYFVNSPEWENVSLHRWGGSTANTVWPGLGMTQIGSTEMYYVDIPTDTTGIIFNNNGEQTANIEGTIGKIYRTTGVDGDNHYTTTEVYSGNTSAEDNPNRNIFFTNNYGWTGKIYVQTIGGANPSGDGGIEMALDHTNDYGEQMYVASVPKDTSKLVFFNILEGQSGRQNQTVQLDYSNEVQGWYITGREVNGEVTINEEDYYYTDENGNIDLPKLVAGRYRVTEVETLEDYLPFTEPIEFNLPFVISTKIAADNNADYKVSLDEDYIESQDENYINYKHLGMNVVNHKQQFYLPLTGVGQNEIWWMLLIGLALFALGGAAWYFVFKKREKLQALKIPTVSSVQDRINRGE